MTISAYELSDPKKFKDAIRSEFKSCIDVDAAEELFRRRYSPLETTTAYIAHEFAKEVFIELYGRPPKFETTDLLGILRKKLDEADQFLLEVEESNDLSFESLSRFRSELVPLLCKDIPPELCSETKLCERIDEVQSLIDNVKWELSNEGSSDKNEP